MSFNKIIIINLILWLINGATWSDKATSQELLLQERRAKVSKEAFQGPQDLLQPDKIFTSLDIIEEKPCFEIQGIALHGAHASHFRWLLRDAKPFIHRCLGLRAIQQLMDYLNQRLLYHGYVTSRVSLPSQNLQTGELQVNVFAGVVEDMVCHILSRQQVLRPCDHTLYHVFPIAKGDVLSVRALEQGIEHIKRLPSQSTTRIEVVPGKNPHGSVIHVQEKEQSWINKWHAGLSIDNTGSHRTGRVQLSGYCDIDDILGWADSLMIYGNTNVSALARPLQGQGLGVMYSVPYKYYLLQLNYGYNRYRYQVFLNQYSAFISGFSHIYTFKLNRTIYRSKSTKVGLYGTLAGRHSEHLLEDMLHNNQSVVTHQIHCGIIYRKLWIASSLDIKLDFQHGVGWFGSSEKFQGEINTRPALWSFIGSYHYQFQKPALRYNLKWVAQHTGDVTLSTAQLSLGGQSTIRGFTGDRFLLAESGAYIRQDLAWTLKFIKNHETKPYIAFDMGTLWGRSTRKSAGQTLAGLAIGLKIHREHLNFDIAWGWAVMQPKGFQSSKSALYAMMSLRI